MWVISAPFDGEVGDVSFQRHKLLKTGATYTLGRKGCSLIIANKKVSSNHCDFEVGHLTAGDAGDPATRPKLNFINKKDKAIRITREGTYAVANPQAMCELQNGDAISLVSGVSISIQWTPVCCYVQPSMGKSPVSVEACASLGIHVVHVPDHHVTHHLLPSYTAQPIVAASLLSACHFTKLEWLQEVLRLGSLPKDADAQEGISLEHTFNLPPLSRYRPTYSPSLHTSQKEPRVWEPNEERLMMFSTYRFLWVDEKARLGDFKEVIERGGGSFETFEANAGKAKFHRALSRGQAKEGKRQIVVGKEKSIIAAIGQGPWKELVEEADTFGLRIHDPEVILQVVIDVDTTLFEAPSTGIDEAPEVTSISEPTPVIQSQEPSAPASEPEEAPTQPRKLVRRVSSRQASREPSLPPSKASEAEEEQELPRPRRALTRRVNAGLPLIIGIDDPSVSLDSTPAVETPAPPPASVDPTSPVRPRPANLKRRLKTAASDILASQNMALSAITPVEVQEEPPLKRFKALFEASDPDNAMSGTFHESAFDTTHEESDHTQTQTQTQRKTSQSGPRGATGNLYPLREEEEETQALETESRGTKRKSTEGLEDEEMGVMDEESTGPKRRAIEGVNSVDNMPSSQRPPFSRVSDKPPSGRTLKEGAPPGKPDQDVQFLKAIASTKKGKKTEDDFDRDFNRLKISKPDLNPEEPEEEWAGVADFGDTDIRGNFMVIVEMQTYHRDKGKKVRDSGNLYEGKDNFKKFKKRGEAVHRTRVQLVLSEGNDYGMGNSYWKGSKFESQSQTIPASNPRTTSMDAEPAGHHPAPVKSQALMVMDDSDEDMAPVKGKNKTAPSSRASSAAPSRRPTTRSKLPSSKKQLPLFIESEGDENELPPTLDDDESVSVPLDSDDEQTLRSTRSRLTMKSTRGLPKKPAPVLVDDDSDDGAVFKGFKGKQRR